LGSEGIKSSLESATS